jgi:inosine/xanthosine triphosphate pyrophosphatase family protein
MRRTLYIATTNAGKLRDFQPAADAYQLTLEVLPGIGNIAAPVASRLSPIASICPARLF